MDLKKALFEGYEYLDADNKFRAYLMDMYPEMSGDLINAILFVYKKDITKLLRNGRFETQDIKNLILEAKNDSIQEEVIIEALQIWGNTFDADIKVLDSINQDSQDDFHYDEFSDFIPDGIITLNLTCSHCEGDLDFNGYCPKCGYTSDIKNFFPEYANTTLFRKALEGDPNSMYELGEKYYNDKSLNLNRRTKQAKYWLEHAANNGLIKAWNDLAIIAKTDDRFFSDNGFAKAKATYDAHSVYMKGAYMGNAYCLYFLKAAVFEGEGNFSPDIVSGLETLSSLAENPRNVESVAAANCILGQIYILGKYGISRDYQRGVNYLKRAADRHDETAYYYLAQCYEKGQGVVANSDEALKYYRMAAQNGIDEAKKYVEKYERQIITSVTNNIQRFLDVKRQIELKKQREEVERKAEEERQRKIRKQKAIKEYWDSHKEELNDINNKIAAANDNISKLEDLNAKKRKEIVQLEKECKEKASEELRYEEATKELDNLKQKLASLSFFKFSAKKELNTQISDKESEMKTLKKVADESRAQRDKEYLFKINALKTEIVQNEKTIKEEQRLINELSNYDPVGDNF